MARIELVNSPVRFDEQKHEYWLGDKQLFGITDVITRQVECAKREYDGVPEQFIKRAGEYGTQVHHSIQHLIQDFEHDGSVEVQDFIDLTKDMNIEASEYNVTDLNHWSSNIDVVSRVDDDTFDLADIKTYSGKLTSTQLTRAQFQLSIYNYLFLLQNKEAKVRNLYIIHVRNKTRKDGSIDHQAEIVPVELIPPTVIKDLLDCDLRGDKWENPYDIIPEEISSQIGHIKELIETKKETEEELNAIKKNVYETMSFLGKTSWETPEIRFTRTKDSTRSSFDLKAFKKDHPDMDLSSYMKVSQISGTLKIAV